MPTTDKPKELAAVLNEAAEWHVWVSSYSATHHFMRFDLHTGDFPRHVIEVECLDVFYFAGLLQGGPYRLKLLSDLGPDGRPESVLVGNDGELRIRCRAFEVRQIRR